MSFRAVEEPSGHSIGGVTTDPFGNTIIAGSFNSSETIGSRTLRTTGGHDAFIIKLDPSGTVVWHHQIGGAGGQTISDITSDNLGNVYAIGDYAGELRPSGSDDSTTSLGSSDLFAIKLSSGNVRLWIKSLGNTAEQRSRHISTDSSQNVTLTFRTTGVLTLDNIGPIGRKDRSIALMKLDTSGNYTWSRFLDDNIDESTHVIAADPAGPILVGGAYRGSFTAPPTPIDSTGGTDIGLAQFAP